MNQGSLSEDVGECINMLRAASEEFPNEPKILLKLAQALHMWGWHKYGARVRPDDASGIIDFDVEYNSQNVYWQEALRVYEKLLKSNPSPEHRETAICQMTPLYCRMGEYEKAKALADAQNALVICKELLLPMATKGEERARYQGERIMALLSNLQLAISESVALNPAISASEYGRQVLLSVVNLYETLFVDGRCGLWHWDIGHLYLTLTHYEATHSGKIQNVLAYFDKGFDHCKEYERIYNEGEYKYSAPLVSNLKSLTKEKGKMPPIVEDFWKKEIKRLPENVCNELRKNEKYTECFA